MSDYARRTSLKLTFSGADVTDDIMPYLLQLTYTDNEEDSADDLQIKLQDREGTWLTQWLSDMIEASSTVKSDTASASSASSSSNSSNSFSVGDKVQFLGGKHYVSSDATSAASTGLAAGPATLTIIKTGAKHPYHVIHTDSTTHVYGWVDTNQIEPLSESGSSSSGSSGSSGSSSNGVDLSKTGFKIKAKITQKYWEDTSKSLSTGQFELDSVTESGPPSEVTIKATALPFSSKIRQTKETKAWESYYLKSIVAEMAADNGMKSTYESSNNPYYSRVEQYQQSDIDFLSTLCHNAGLSLKATNNTIVVFDQATYESKSAVRTISKGDGTYISYSLKNGQADTEYNSCRVSYTTKSGKKISATAYLSDYDDESETNQQLEIRAKVSSTSEAKTLAAKMLRMYNKYENTATFTLPGDTTLVAGVTVQLKKFGMWNGKYIVKSAKHTISTSGYQVQLTLRKVLEGY